MATTTYQAVDYNSLFGSNPFSAGKSEIETLITRLRDKLAQSSPLSSTGLDDDSIVRDYMDHSLGAQRKLLDDYVKAAAGAGIKRGGFGIMGGPRTDSALAYSAIQNLAKDYSTRLKQALEHAGQVRDSQRKQYQDDMLNLQKLLNVKKGYLSEEADWKEKLAEAIRSDWEKQVEWRRQDEAAKSQAEADRAKYGTERMKAEAELNRLRQEMSQKLKDQADWNRLMKKAGMVDFLGRFGANWSGADDYTLKKLANW